MKEIDKLYDVQGAAERLIVSPRTIREWLRSGELGGVKIGKKGIWRIRESDIQSFLKSGEESK